jgi:hypothetical protein
VYIPQKKSFLNVRLIIPKRLSPATRYQHCADFEHCGVGGQYIERGAFGEICQRRIECRGDVCNGTGTNLYWPDDDSEKHLTYHPEDTIYQATRDDMNGTEGGIPHFRVLWNEILQDIDTIILNYKSR